MTNQKNAQPTTQVDKLTQLVAQPIKKNTNTPHIAGEHQSLIESIKTPLGFFSLIVLMINALFVSLVYATTGSDRTLILVAMVIILLTLILVVAIVAVWKPEALWGKRYAALEVTFARGLGEEISTTLDAYLSGIKEADQEEVFQLLRQTIVSSPHASSKATRDFCNVLAETIIRRAKLKGAWHKKNGNA
jgi:hypothetical protein